MDISAESASAIIELIQLGGFSAVAWYLLRRQGKREDGDRKQMLEAQKMFAEQMRHQQEAFSAALAAQSVQSDTFARAMDECKEIQKGVMVTLQKMAEEIKDIRDDNLARDQVTRTMQEMVSQMHRDAQEREIERRVQARSSR